ncbi:MAG: class I SAM-dependent methyltransferase [Clostridia bacterium]|nr:class I SAM-dependent methyltransferase [Clostridia bacterium]
MDSLTAKVSCFARAYHYRHNTTRIFSDTAAERLLGSDYDQIARSMSQGAGFFLPGFQGSAEEGLRLIMDGQLSPSVLGRSAFCEAALEREKRLGCRQYVLFASGYDTFAIRNEDASLSVFELDLPEALAVKKARINRAGLKSGAVYVPCDLSGEQWKDGLAESGFRREELSFASLLGISYYLSRDEFKNLLAGLGGVLRGGSNICFDYPSEDGGREALVNRALAQGAGERMKARYAAGELENLLEACGFLTREHLDHGAMTGRFFSEYNECNPAHRMEAPQGVGYVLAVRKP